MSVALRGAAVVPSGNPTTGFTVTVPASVAADDLLFLALTSRDSVGAGTLAVTDNDAGGNAWSKIANSTDHKATLWYKRATSGSAGKTVTVANAVGSASGVLKCFSGGSKAATPYANVAVETNNSADETHAGITPTAANAMVCCSVHNYANDNAVTSLSFATLGATTATEFLSTGGSDCGCIFGHKAQSGNAAATGNLTWAQTDGTTYSIVWTIVPEMLATSATTNAAATVSGAATHDVVGTATPTGAAATASATATAPLVGTTSATGAAATTTTAAVVPVNGSTSATGQADSLSAGGIVEAPEIIASLGQTAEAAAVAASAAVAVGGATDVTGATSTLSGAASVSLTGTASLTGEASTSTTVSSVSLTGAASTTNDAASVSGAGAVALVGTSALTSAASTSSGSGAIAIDGSTDATNGADTLDALGGGVPVIVATAALVNDAASLTSAGTIEIDADADLSSDAATVVGQIAADLGDVPTVTVTWRTWSRATASARRVHTPQPATARSTAAQTATWG